MLEYKTMDQVEDDDDVTLNNKKDPGIGRVYDTIEEQSLEWLWPNRVPVGQYILLSGMGGVSKSFFTCMLAAHVSTGKAWPDGAMNPEINGSKVLMINHEDKPEISLKKRLRDAGADLSNIVQIEYGRDSHVRLTSSGKSKFKLPEHLESLEEAIMYYNARLVILDPISRCLSENISITSPKVQPILESLLEISLRRGCTILCINHLSKGQYNPDNITSKILGHESLNSLARMSYLAYKDPRMPEICLLKQIKNNIAPLDEKGLAYRKVTTTSGRTFIEVLDGFNTDDQEVIIQQQMSKNRKKVLLALQETKQEMRPHELANMCNVDCSNMRSLLRRMVVSNEITCTAYGFYGLPGWKTSKTNEVLSTESQVLQELQVSQVLQQKEIDE